MVRIKKIVLRNKITNNDIDSLDDSYKISDTECFAHVTAVSGYQAQINLVGKQYESLFVARIKGYKKANSIVLDNKEYEIIQVRYHGITRTDIYFGNKGSDENALE